MACLHFCRNFVAVISDRQINIYGKRQGEDDVEKKVLYRQEEEKEKEDDGDKKKETSLKDKKSDPHAPRGQILAAKFSPSGNLFACCDDEKCLRLWKTSSWELLSQRSIQKRCTAITFSHRDEDIFVADKFGDVYRFSSKDSSHPGELILGHVSMLLDVIITPDDSFIITCERDEKIRVSCLPNAYNIHGYCLGHTEFVSRCQLLPNHSHVLLSAGGDSTVRLWDYIGSSQLTSIPINHESTIRKSGEHFTVTHLSCSKDGYVAIALLSEKVVIVYKMMENSSELQITEFTKLEFGGQILYLSFDLSGYLWVIQGSPNDSVQVYHPTSDGIGSSELSRVHELSEKWLSKALQMMNEEWEFLKASLDVGRPLEFLHKKSYDNMADYMSKKEQRVAEELVRKEKYEARQSRQAQRKRMKLEEKESIQS
ncbi:tRNA (guanine-N(7)-)-methyltransferase non-catalytic subunit WDR4 [Holothuria leucospilota]|uniref:tRNA (guanine-N(7)-)-methyltransferase non-catalytic subunit n=1 Tax=Holothuria leucospilota TaxID=206669 RepID=A0A9Q1CU94_HOLLE|nr:tRNA (guanine-N(7)-)-methyltransferase non-catalytic subunit WDR4 [Holothuria leucospilota]